MASLRSFLGLTFVFVGTLTACGGSTTGNAEGSGGSASTGGSSAIGGATSNSCSVVDATIAQMGTFAAQGVCIKANCSANLPPCLGEGYAQGNFGTSPCASYAACVTGCNCVSSCSNNCAVPDECTNCLSNNLFACAFTHCN